MSAQPLNPENAIDPTTLTGVSSYRQRQKEGGNERTDVYLSKELKTRIKQLATSQNQSTPDTLQACLELGVFCLEQGLTLVQLAPNAQPQPQPQPTPSLDAITGSLTANPYSSSLTRDFTSNSVPSVFAPQSAPDFAVVSLENQGKPPTRHNSTPVLASNRSISADDALQAFLLKRKNKRP